MKANIWRLNTVLLSPWTHPRCPACFLTTPALQTSFSTGAQAAVLCP